MRRGVVCLCAALLGALLIAASVQSAQTRSPRFLATISGTQHFEWTLEYSGDCSFKGHGEQSETFGTSRPVKVIAPLGAAGSYEFQAFRRGGWGRTVPLAGRETRVYRVLKAPAGQCPALAPAYRSDCRGTNPLLPRAGVVLMRLKQQGYLHVPVDIPWIDRTPGVCNILLFDIRNFYEAAVFGLRQPKPVRGGTFENRRAKTLRFAISVRYCADGNETELVFRPRCGRSSGDPVLTGEITTSWSVTLRRTR